MTTGTGYRRMLPERRPLGPDSPPAPAESRRNALVVDDDPTIARLLIFYLREAGFTPIYAPDGLQALSLAARHKLSLVLLDVMLPGLNGWEVCRELRQMSNVPIIMLTSKSSEYDVNVGLSAGADDYIAKPFNGQELLTHIEQLMSRQPPPAAEQAARQSRREAPRASVPPQQEPASAPLVIPEQQTRKSAQHAGKPGAAPLPGTQLRRARRTAQITLPQVEHKTGIRWDYLQALEQDELSLIPRQLQQPILTRYAQFLGIDPDPLWQQYMASGRAAAPGRANGSTVGVVIALALLALLALLVALYVGII